MSERRINKTTAGINQSTHDPASYHQTKKKLMQPERKTIKVTSRSGKTYYQTIAKPKPAAKRKPAEVFSSNGTADKKGRRKTYDAMKQMMESGYDFQAEKNPPEMPSTRFNIPEVLAYKEKLFKTVDKLTINGAFIIPTVLKAATQRYLQQQYGDEYRFRYFIIPDNIEMMRVYKLKA